MGFLARAGPAVRPGAGLAAARATATTTWSRPAGGGRDRGPGRRGRGRRDRCSPCWSWRCCGWPRSGRPAHRRRDPGGAGADRRLGRAARWPGRSCSRTRRSPRTAPCGWPRPRAQGAASAAGPEGVRRRGGARPVRATCPPEQLLTGLRGKDVVFGVRGELRPLARSRTRRWPPTSTRCWTTATAELTAAGFAARSGYLTSPTSGGGSWLAHATFQSGLWIDNQQRYRQLTAQRPADPDQRVPARPAGSTVGVDAGQHARLAGGRASTATTRSTTRATWATAGPAFGWAPMPDQYTLSRVPAERSTARAGPRPADGRDHR